MSKDEGKSRRWPLWLLLGLLAAGVLVYILMNYISGLTSPSGSGARTFVKTGVSVSFGGAASFYATPSGKGFYYATDDGIKFLGNDGTVQMVQMYNLRDPLLAGEGDTAAVAQQNGSNLYVYTPSGELYEKQLQYPILSFSINSKGYACVVTQNGDAYEISVFNAQGGLIWDQQLADANVFLVGTDVSNDGRLLTELTYDINSVNTKSILNFYYLNKSEAASHGGNLFATNSDGNGEMIGSVRFMNDNSLVYASDTEIACIAPEKSGKKLWSVPLANKLDAVACNDTNLYAYALGDGLINQNGAVKGTVDFIGVDGKAAGEFLSPKPVTDLYAGQNAFLVSAGRSFTAVDAKGKVLWQYTSAQDVKQILFLNDTSHILLVTGGKADVMKLGTGDGTQETGVPTLSPVS